MQQDGNRIVENWTACWKTRSQAVARI